MLMSEKLWPSPSPSPLPSPSLSLALRRRCLRTLGALPLWAWGAGQSLPAAAASTTAPVAGRVVALGGAITEVVYALGAEGQLVGTDTTSLYPAAALQTAKVGYMRQLSAEGLLSLRPDAVLGTDEAGQESSAGSPPSQASPAICSKCCSSPPGRGARDSAGNS